MFKPTFLAVAVPTVATVLVSDSSLALYYLLAALFGDFATGIGASIIMAKRENPEAKIRNIVSSEKLRKSFIKTVFYFLMILATYGLETMLRLKTITFSSISDMEFTVTFISIGLCIAVELWSIFMENLPKCGFDIAERLKVVVMGVNKIRNEIN